MSDAFSIITGLIIVVPGVVSFFKSRGNQSDVVKLKKQLEEQRKVDIRLQQQIDEKNKQIEELQLQNEEEEAIIEDKYPGLSEAIATLLSGQSVIIEELRKEKK